MKDGGFIYFVCNWAYSARLLVSLASLRKIHPSIPAAVLSPELPPNPVHDIAADPRLNVRVVPMSLVKTRRMRNAAYVTKTTLHRWTPFDNNIFLDADTLVTGMLHELWPRYQEEIVLTQFSNWVTTGRKISGRCKQFKDVSPDLVARALSSAKPAINNGVLGFHRKAAFLDAWHALAMKRIAFITDEISAQLLHPDFPHRIEEDRFNRSRWYGKTPPDKTCVWHYHGEAHAKKSPDPLWLAQYLECLRDNLGNCREWIGTNLHPLERKVLPLP